jgi:hypothetical protein
MAVPGTTKRALVFKCFASPSQKNQMFLRAFTSISITSISMGNHLRVRPPAIAEHDPSIPLPSSVPFSQLAKRCLGTVTEIIWLQVAL